MNPFTQKIHPPSPNPQTSQKVKRSHSANQPTRQQLRHPSSPIPVPHICISPQEEVSGKLRRQSPDSPKNDMMNYNSLNAYRGHERKHRSVSPSPCRRGGRDNYSDGDGNSPQRNILKMNGSSQECSRNGGFDLSASAPEHTLRQMMGPRERRLYSIPHRNFLGVPQSHIPQFMSNLNGKENDKKTRLYSSHTNLFEDQLGFGRMNRQNKALSRSTCGQELVGDMSPKSKYCVLDVVRGVIRSFGLSPRGSPRHSPASSRSTSPCNSPSPSPPYGSPFSPLADSPPVRPF